MRNLPSHSPGTASAMQPTLAATQRPPRAPHTWAVVLRLSTMALTAIVSLLGSHGVWAAGNAPPPSHEKGYLTPAPRGEGFHFWHRDWELACDNTRTCRAAGYHSKTGPMAISLLLTRAGGPHEPVTATLQLGGDIGAAKYGLAGTIYSQLLPQAVIFPCPLKLTVNQRQVDEIECNFNSPINLSTEQTEKLTKALKGKSVVELANEQFRWRLSGTGAVAVFLKMDEAQGRIGTPGAMVRKGTRSEASVPAARAVPEQIAYALPAIRREASPAFSAQTMKALRQHTTKSSCPALFNTWHADALNIIPLPDDKWLVSTRCQDDEYDFSFGLWQVSTKPNSAPILFTTHGQEPGMDGALNSVSKDSDFGDCQSFKGWNWDGNQFIQTRVSTTGLCRHVMLGGTWQLPTLVTNVKPAPR